jgi:drug/metabolite transporter (DMT)-like permease
MRSWGNWVRFGALGLIWGSSFLWIKIALGGLSPIQITLTRVVLGALVLFALCWLGRRRIPRDWRIWLHVLVVAFFGCALPFTLLGFGEQTVGSGIAGSLNATTPLWTLLISLIVTDERLGVLRLSGLILGFVGTLLIFAPWQASGMASWGALACLIAGMSYGIGYVYLARRLSARTSPIPLAASQLTVAAGLAAIALPVAGLQPVRWAAGPLIAVAVLGIFGTGLAYALNNRLISDEGATVASSVTYLVPPVSVLLGAMVLSEPLNARVIVGMVVVLAGVAMSRGRRPPTTVTPTDGRLPNETARTG